jgi:hypothetical protein
MLGSPEQPPRPRLRGKRQTEFHEPQHNRSQTLINSAGTPRTRSTSSPAPSSSRTSRATQSSRPPSPPDAARESFGTTTLTSYPVTSSTARSPPPPPPSPIPAATGSDADAGGGCYEAIRMGGNWNAMGERRVNKKERTANCFRLFWEWRRRRVAKRRDRRRARGNERIRRAGASVNRFDLNISISLLL